MPKLWPPTNINSNFYGTGAGYPEFCWIIMRLSQLRKGACRPGETVMRTLAMLAGTGWLRPRGSIAFTVKYRLAVLRQLTGPKAGDVVCRGTIEADGIALAEAREVVHATLTVASGEPVNVDVSGTDPDAADITVVGRLPTY